MKKSIRIIAVAVAAIILCMSLASCGLFGKKLDGKYESDLALLGKYTLNFEGKEVTVSVKNLLGQVDKYEGTYEIDDDTISFEFLDDDGEEIEGAPFSDDTYAFEEDEDTGDITIGNWVFEKVDD
ncbi:MAG: hypothetical protein IJ011_03405 [Clostridia bacterium]|nr:hypothetical protein [Clostridia bacterium]